MTFEVKGAAADIQLKVQLWQMQLDLSRLLTEFLDYLFVVIYHQKSFTKSHVLHNLLHITYLSYHTNI